MVVSEKIKSKMYKLAKLCKEGQKLSKEIDDYFEENGYDIE